MKAMVCESYGPPEVLQLKDMATPVPKSNEILIKVEAATVTSGDCRVRGRRAPLGFGFLMRLALGFHGPRQPVLGTELAGTVVATGDAVSRFALGDPVFAFTDMAMGCYAEYVCIAEDALVRKKPDGLTMAEAAALSFGGTTALHFLEKTQLQKGQRLLIVGASGCVGSAILQLGKGMGAEVTAVCSAANRQWVQALGADHIIDSTADDVIQVGSAYDVIIDTTGTASYPRYQKILVDHGRIALIAASLPDMLWIPWVRITNHKKIIAGPATVTVAQIEKLAELAEQGKFHPVIDRTFDFEQLIEAHHYVDGGHKKGNVIVVFPQD